MTNASFVCKCIREKQRPNTCLVYWLRNFFCCPHFVCLVTWTLSSLFNHITQKLGKSFFQFQGNPYSNRTTCLRTCTLQPPPPLPFHKSFPPTPSPFFINEETYLVSIETSLILIFKLFICLILFCKVNRKNIGAFKTANNKKNRPTIRMQTAMTFNCRN